MIDQLPTELLACIFEYLSPADCVALGKVNQKLRTIVRNHPWKYPDWPAGWPKATLEKYAAVKRLDFSRRHNVFSFRLAQREDPFYYVSSDKRRAISSYEGDFLLYDIKNKAILARLEGHLLGSSALNEQHVAWGSFSDNIIRLWDAQTGNIKAMLGGHDGCVTALALSPHHLFSGSLDRTARLWDLESSRCLCVMTADDIVLGVALSDKYITFGTASGAIQIMDLPTQNKMASLRGPDAVSSLTIFQDYLASGFEQGELILWSVQGRCLKMFRGHDDLVSCLAFSPDGTSLVSGSHDTTIKIWSTNKQNPRKSLRIHDDKITDVKCFDGYVLSCSLDGRILSTNTIREK